MSEYSELMFSAVGGSARERHRATKIPLCAPQTFERPIQYHIADKLARGHHGFCAGMPYHPDGLCRRGKRTCA
jgi:hypothetical protein